MAGEITDLEKKIIRQIEYYFGDANLPRDRFLQEEVRKEDGWVALETMVKFNRLKQISDDLKVILEAVKKSTSGLMEINEEDLKIRRSPDKPIPENTEQRRQDLAAKTVYAKEFPLDATLDQVQEFFEKYGEIESVFLRKNEKKLFKGSVFATFKSDESVQAFLKDDSATFKDTKLEVKKTKSDYFKGKQDERKQNQQEKEKKRNDAKNRQEDDEKKKIENQLVKGAMLHLAGIVAETSREDIKNMLQDYGPIAWVEFNRGDTEALVRYDQENQAKEVLDKLLAAKNNEITLNEAKVEGRVLEGEEEKEKWVKMYEDMKERRFSNKRKGGRSNYQQNQRGGGKRPGRRPCRGKRDEQKARLAAGGDSDGQGGNDSGDDEPPKKQAKVDETSPKKQVKVDESGE